LISVFHIVIGVKKNQHPEKTFFNLFPDWFGHWNLLCHLQPTTSMPPRSIPSFIPSFIPQKPSIVDVPSRPPKNIYSPKVGTNCF
jgi:hypothetical protein